MFVIAAELGVSATERDLTAYDLYVADEAFLSATTGGIIAIAIADGRRIGAGTHGPITARITARYWALHLSGPDVTPVYP